MHSLRSAQGARVYLWRDTPAAYQKLTEDAKD